LCCSPQACFLEFLETRLGFVLGSDVRLALSYNPDPFLCFLLIRIFLRIEILNMEKKKI
jgi:hypothetical protein